MTGLEQILLHGTLGETHNVGSSSERTNRYVVETILDILDRVIPGPYPRRKLIRFVTDRPGYQRYAINSTKIKEELGWEPMYSFESGIEETVMWYLNNETWWRNLEERSNDAIFTPENMLNRFDDIHRVATDLP